MLRQIVNSYRNQENPNCIQKTLPGGIQYSFMLPTLPEYVATVENNCMSYELMNEMVIDSHTVLQSIVGPKSQVGNGNKNL